MKVYYGLILMIKNIVTKGFLEFWSRVPKLAFIQDSMCRGEGNKQV